MTCVVTDDAAPDQDATSPGDEMLSDSERRLTKGMARRTWTGPPLLDSVGGGTSDMSALHVSGKGQRGEGGRVPRCSTASAAARQTCQLFM